MAFSWEYEMNKQDKTINLERKEYLVGNEKPGKIAQIKGNFILYILSFL